jgi:predicted permease
MSLFRELGRRLLMLLRRRQFDADLEEEMRLHRELREREQIERGFSLKEAHYAAQRRFGNDLALREQSRDTWGWNWLEGIGQDIRYSLRMLRKNPGFTAVAVIVLAVGISGAMAMFGFADAALIKPLPYRDPSRLVVVFVSSPGYARSWVSYRDFADWKRLNKVFSSIDAYALNGGFTLKTANGAEQVPGTRVSSGFFHTLGATPSLGRDFHVDEDSSGADPTVIISYSAWQNRFGARKDVLGQAITLNGARTTIIGVLPRDFQFALYGDAEFWTTLRASDVCEQHRGCHNLMTIARLRDGSSIESASSDMRLIARQLQRQYPEDRDFGSANLVPLRDVILGDVRPILLVVLSGAGFLLLIACVNVSALLVARSDKRRREIAVRGALGASAGRLIRQFASEGLVLVMVAGIVALMCAEWAMRLVPRCIPTDMIAGMPFLRESGVNAHALVLAAAIALVATILFSVIPSMYVPLEDVQKGLAEGGRGTTATMWRRVGANLAVAEVAVAVVLLVGAGLLGRSFYLLLHVELGFRADHLASIQTGWAPGSYTEDRPKIVLEREIVERISMLPGVKSAALSMAPPVDSAWGTISFHVAGRPNRGEANEVLYRPVSSGFFKTLQAKLLRGRYFEESEDATKPLVAVVNRTLMLKYFPSEDPTGKQIYSDGQPHSLMQIVGVVDDIKEGPLEGKNLPALYLPNNQNPVTWPVVLVRTSQLDAPFFQRIVAAIHDIDPYISVSREETMMQRINDSPSAYLHRSSALLVGTFAATALVLCVVGLYGVLAYSVGQRIHEIGIRMALGAERWHVLQMVLGEGAKMALLGVAIGLAAALGLTRLMASLVFGVSTRDPLTFAGVAVLFVLVALAACYIPARRAAKVDPMVALRHE